jgi:short-subunit dehydrogenase
MGSLTQTTKPLTWLITGSSSGIGLQLARHALAAGHKVIATSRNPGKTPDLVSEVTSQGGRWLRLDADDQNCGQVITDLEQAGTQIDVLVNSAGFAISGPAEAFTEAEVRSVMETDFFGPYRLMRAAVPFMRARRSGVIVNISSAAGLQARPSLSVYGAAKSALDSKFTSPSHPLNKEIKGANDDNEN